MDRSRPTSGSRSTLLPTTDPLRVFLERRRQRVAPRTQQQHTSFRGPRENQLDKPDGLSPTFREELGILLLAGEDFRDAEIVFTKPAPEARTSEQVARVGRQAHGAGKTGKRPDGWALGDESARVKESELRPYVTIHVTTTPPNSSLSLYLLEMNGGRDRTRTCDLVRVNQMGKTENK